MMRQIEFSVCFEVALKAGRRVLARIDDEFAAAAPDAHVLAPRSVAGFTPGRRRPFQVVLVKPRMRAGGKNAGDVAVAFCAGLVAEVMRAFDLRRLEDGPLHGGTGTEQQRARACHRQDTRKNKPSPLFHP